MTYNTDMDKDRLQHAAKKYKKWLIAAAVMVLLVIVAFIVLTIAAIDWLLTRGEDVKKTAEVATQHVESASTPLNLDSYINGDQVNIDQLTGVYNALPSQLQDAWLGDLKAQIDDLKNQAGIANETIQSLTNLYQTLSQSQ
jgi:hypothetical protein